MCARARTRTPVCVFVESWQKNDKEEALLRPKFEEPIHLAKELQLHQDNEAASQAFN